MSEIGVLLENIDVAYIVLSVILVEVGGWLFQKIRLVLEILDLN